MKKWTYVTTAKDAVGSSISAEYVTDDWLCLFDTKEEAFAYASGYAEEECESLNDGCDPRLSFGVPEDDLYESKDEVKVCCYDENDDTEVVTRRSIREVRSL